MTLINAWKSQPPSPWLLALKEKKSQENAFCSMSTQEARLEQEQVSRAQRILLDLEESRRRQHLVDINTDRKAFALELEELQSVKHEELGLRTSRGGPGQSNLTLTQISASPELKRRRFFCCCFGYLNSVVNYVRL